MFGESVRHFELAGIIIFIVSILSLNALGFGLPVQESSKTTVLSHESR